MKVFRKKIVLVGLLAIIVATSCKKTWFDINTNPNSAVDTNIDPAALLPGALTSTATNVNTGYLFLSRWMGYLVTSSGVSPDAEEQSYNISNTFSSGTFTGLLDLNFDLQSMQNKAASTNSTFYTGVAKIIKSYNYARLVDAYNDIPYSQNFLGTANLTPKYDNAQTVYEDLVNQIDAGIIEIKTADLALNARYATADIMFKGDKVKWAQFGNTLKLRLLLHQAARADRQEYIKAQIAKIVAEGSGFLGTGASAFVNPGYSQSLPNPYYNTYNFNTTGGEPSQFRANIYALNLFKTNNDPRVAYVYQPIKTTPPSGFLEPQANIAPTNYRGGVYGLAIDNATYKYQTRDYLSKIGGIVTNSASGSASTGIIKGWDMSSWLITSIESMFLQAEAIQRGYISGIANTAYSNAVKESFRWLNATGSQSGADASFTTWYNAQVVANNQNVSFEAAPDKLKLIAFQKYLSLCGIDEFEIWNDYRKNGSFPNIPLSLYTGRTSNAIPVRLLYPQTEISYNTANVPSAGSKTGDQFTAKIFWMP